MADNNSVYTGAAMTMLQGFANNAFATANQYLGQLSGYMSDEINTNYAEIEPPDPLEPVEIDENLLKLEPEPIEFPDPTAFGWKAGTAGTSGTSGAGVPELPVGKEYEFPVKPVYDLPTAPTLTEIEIPEFADGVIAGITTQIPSLGTLPTIDPYITASVVEDDSLMTAIKARIAAMIVNGGTLLNPQVEADIWNRDLERHEQQLADSTDKIARVWAKKGFSLPDGLLAHSIAELHVEHMNKKLDRSREIAVKQAELEQAGLFKALEAGVSVEHIVLTSLNEGGRRVLDAAKATVDATIQVFKSRVERYNTLLEGFKADALAWKTGVEAEIGRAEVFKARISGMKTIAEIDDTKVKSYVAQISAVGQLADVYNSEVKAVAIMYEAEKTKVDRYRAIIDAYVATIEGFAKKYMADLEGWKAHLQAYSISADNQTKRDELTNRTLLAQLEARIKTWEIGLKQILDQTGLRMEALKTVASASSNLAAGALSAIHASVSDSYSNSYSQSHSWDETTT